MKFVGVIMTIAPLGLGAYFANLVATYGPEIIGDYGRSMLVYYPLCLLYAVIFFPLYAFMAGGKLGISTMVKHIFPPAITAFATQSSAATIPVNKEACDAIGVPKDISDLVPVSYTHLLPLPIGSELQKSRGIQRDDVQFPLPGQSGH